MTFLPVSNPTPIHRETLYSYLSRLAAVWQTKAPDLAKDMGASFKLLLEQDEAAIESFADWAGLQPEVMAELLSWTGVRAGNVRMKFRDELYTSRALRNPIMRGCPICLQEDVAQAGEASSTAMAMRGHWQMREAHLCVQHHHPLVRFWEASKPRSRFDIGARLQEIKDDILSGALDCPRQTPTAYDLWLDQRLEDGSDDTWLKDHPVFVTTTFCRLLGEVLLNEPDSEQARVFGTIHSAAFDVVVQGEEAIREAFHQIASRATGALDEPYKIFGKLFSRLQHEYRDEQDFHPFRDLLRDCIFANWPIAAGEEVLGKAIESRKLHSLRTAERETGIGAKVLEQFLVEAGAFSADDNRPPNRKIFDAQAYAELLIEIPTLVGPIAMREAMGATRQELSALTDARVLVPRTQVEKVKNPWRICDGLSLVLELSRDAVPVDAEENDWETLLLACARRDTNIARLVQAIREKRLSVGHRIGVSGFHGIVLRKSEVDRITSPLRRAKKASLSDLSGTVPAATVGRSVGLRNGGTFQLLIEAGYVSARQITNPHSGRSQYRMTPEDIAAFHERFVTLTTLSDETLLHRNTLRGLITAQRIKPFSPEGQDFGAIYRREDIAPIMKSVVRLAH
ncbi:TniQ family protein [Donghicola tyrosinivorans]|uniref:TniQ protein n=1 Tax=Donghicola tyrosinivorans TaxID=1652492 RepID=A0A2T0WS34_9RHOB|nr:TniQ family protein [Donghicola tyrosinivorans]PRY89500.1 TniQ protein [Donghicola tyrosinivorans]